jgi:hypothetical protein
MIALLQAMFTAIQGRYKAKNSYLNTLQARAYLVSTLKPRMSTTDCADFEYRDALLRFQGTQALEHYNSFRDMEEDIRIMMEREKRSQEYSNALWHLA